MSTIVVLFAAGAPPAAAAAKPRVGAAQPHARHPHAAGARPMRRRRAHSGRKNSPRAPLSSRVRIRASKCPSGKPRAGSRLKWREPGLRAAKPRVLAAWRTARCLGQPPSRRRRRRRRRHGPHARFGPTFGGLHGSFTRRQNRPAADGCISRHISTRRLATRPRAVPPRHGGFYAHVL